ncbi:glycine cleavage system protein R [Microbacterium telephonicum]|uniref:Glycine cleavage system regulatory protein n=1 Tax=Microbacterium telephonicum TaxID=1714841 RepID=A0A498C0G2_9MICO|nr:ACT domain-containing protein [Microbacterium telephonicum]RLK49155.1 glycine cleavage system regulatory protein [Microbacterium telephonicum]
MAHLVLTVVGDDRAGLVRALADTVAVHGGNWERSELAELAGAFAGIVLVTVPDDAAAGLVTALQALDGMLRVTTHTGTHVADAAASRTFSFTVLGNDRPGIVREVTSAIAANALSIDSFTSRTLEAPMAGGTLFEAEVSVRVPADADLAPLVTELERIAGEIQVDLTLA